MVERSKTSTKTMIEDEVAEKRHLMRLVAAKEIAGQRVKYATKHHKDTRGRPLNFNYRHYLKLPYADPSPDITLRVPVQIGKTEWQVCDSLACASLGLSVFSVQPKFELRGVHVAERFDKLIGASPHYLAMVRHNRRSRDSTTLKHFGPGTLRFVGSRVESDMIGFPADTLEIDELDRCDLNILVLAEDRLQESDYKLIRRTSTPTLPGSTTMQNIDFFFTHSDQKRWFVRCPECRFQQEIRWDTHLIVIEHDTEGRVTNAGLMDESWTEGKYQRTGQRIKLACLECGAPVDRLAPGVWIPQNPKIRDRSGYTMSRMIAVTTEVENIWLEFEKALGNPSAMQRVVNSFLGEPYSGIGDRFSVELLDIAATTLNPYMAPLDPEKVAPGGSTMGIDVNRPYFDVRISDYPYERQEGSIRRLIFAGKTTSENDLRNWIAKYKVRTCCVDAEPEARWALNFQRTAPCMVWRVQYRHGSEGLIARDMDADTKRGLITLDRTVALDELLAEYSNHRVALPMNYKELEDGAWAKEMAAGVRVMETDNGVERYVWKSDFAHALHVDNYDNIARKIGHHMPSGLGRGFSLDSIMSSRSEFSETIDAIEAISKPNAERSRSGFREGVFSDVGATSGASLDR